MRNSTADINSLWARLMVEELVRNDVDTFVVCPGSRSSALALAVAQNLGARSQVHFDERGAAFFALGHVSATRQPAALICTSGTAVANFFPAIIECSKKKLPLIILTADRPPELRRTGAHQTIEQPGIFGEYVRFQFDLPCPTPDIAPAMVLTTIDQAVYRARHPLAGPVHVNCMFREPLMPAEAQDGTGDELVGLGSWPKTDAPYTEYHAPRLSVSDETIRKAVKIFNGTDHGLILAGKLNSDRERSAVLALAQKLQWPIFADVTSGLRLSPSRGPVVHYFDQLLLSQAFVDSLKVDCVLQAGGRMTSKRVNQLIEARKPKHMVMVLNHPLRHDPAHQVTMRIEARVESFCAAVVSGVKARRESSQLIRMLALSRKVGQRIEQLSGGRLSEPSVARVISQNIGVGHGLFLGNSMPIRDMDMYGAPAARQVVIGANRGASGIDGTIATAAGFAQGAKRPVTLLVGDLAALHDLNSLALLSSLKYPLIIVILNNDGGGIFSFLDSSRAGAHFERFFGTSHELHFDAAAKMFGVSYHRPKTLTQFVQTYKKAIRGTKSKIIEVVTDRRENFQLHADWQHELSALIEKNLNKE